MRTRRARTTSVPRDANEAELDALMSRLADGDRDAFVPLFEALRPRAVRLARARLGASLAEDAAQATLLRVFTRASDFESGRAVLPWFYAIAANEVRAIERRVRSSTEPPPNSISLANDPECELDEREMRRAIDRAIAELDDDAARAILAMLDDAPPPNLEPSTFRKRVSRAYAKLRVILGVPNVD
jgi:RNA polymerase sigma factor (sigma-70 family)